MSIPEPSPPIPASGRALWPIAFAGGGVALLTVGLLDNVEPVMTVLGGVMAVAAALDVAGVRRADTVAVIGPKNAEQIVALLAIASVGAVYVPVTVW